MSKKLRSSLILPCFTHSALLAVGIEHMVAKDSRKVYSLNRKCCKGHQCQYVPHLYDRHICLSNKIETYDPKGWHFEDTAKHHVRYEFNQESLMAFQADVRWNVSDALGPNSIEIIRKFHPTEFVLYAENGLATEWFIFDNEEFVKAHLSGAIALLPSRDHWRAWLDSSSQIVALNRRTISRD
jgi:hypothetical protein